MPEAIGAALVIAGIVTYGLLVYPLVAAIFEASLLRAFADPPDMQGSLPPAVRQVPYGRLVLYLFVKSLVTVISFVLLLLFFLSDGGLRLHDAAALVGTLIALGSSIAIGMAPFRALLKRFNGLSDKELAAVTRRAALVTPLSIILAAIVGVGLFMAVESLG